MPSTNTPNAYGAGWKKSKAEAYIDLECPTGTWCQIRKPNPRALVTLGFLDRLDTLNGVIQSKHIKRVKGEAKIDTTSLIKDPTSLMGMLELADRVVEYVVIQPTVQRPYVSTGVDGEGNPTERQLRGDERDDEVIYTDELDDADKMFIFSLSAGGDPDLATFRKLYNESAANLGNVEQVAGSSKRVAVRRK
jgi:hypothetical protein